MNVIELVLIEIVIIDVLNGKLIEIRWWTDIIAIDWKWIELQWCGLDLIKTVQGELENESASHW